MKLIVFLSIIAVFVIWYKTMDAPRPTQTRSAKEKGITYGQLKQIRENSAKEMALKKNRAELENQVLTPRVNSSDTPDDVVPHVVDMPRDSATYDTEDKTSGELPTLDAQMNAFLAEKQKFKEMRKERREQFAEDFIKKARAMGYMVIMDEQMQITEVRKVPPKQ